MPDLDFLEQAQWVIHISGLIEGAFAAPPATLGAYFAALQQRNRFLAAWDRFFAEWDVLLCPAALTTAPLLDDPRLIVDGEEVPLLEIRSLEFASDVAA